MAPAPVKEPNSSSRAFKRNRRGSLGQAVAFNCEELEQFLCSPTPPSMEWIAKFSYTVMPDGKPFVWRFRRDKDVCRFFLALVNRARLTALDDDAVSSDQDSLDWVDEQSDDEKEREAPSKVFNRAQRLWNRLPKKKQLSIIQAMRHQAQELLRQRRPSVQEARRSSLGLFSRNFDWEKLPPALKVVYDKQGHRQELIDGRTFWRFFTECTIADEHEVTEPPGDIQDDDAGCDQDNDEEEDYENDDGPTPQDVLEAIERMLAAVPPEAATRFGKALDLPLLRREDEILSNEARQKLMRILEDCREDSDEKAEELQRFQTALIQLAESAEMNELSLSTDHNADAFQKLVQERKADPERHHLGVLWEELLAGAEYMEQRRRPRIKLGFFTRVKLTLRRLVKATA